MRISSDSRPWEVGVCQKAALAIEGGAVAMKARGEDDGDVHVHLGALQLAVGHSLEAQGGHVLPHVEGPPDGVVGLLSTHFGRDVLDAAKRKKWMKGRREGRSQEMGGCDIGPHQLPAAAGVEMTGPLLPPEFAL